MMDYAFAGDFRKCPLGAFTLPNKMKVWTHPSGGVSADFDPDGTVFSIVDDKRFPGGRACRMLYPKGHYGMSIQSYQIRIKAPETTANIEFYWLFERNFSFYTPNADRVGGGKIGPCINWGEIGGPTEKRGTRSMWWWNGHGSLYGHPVFSPSCQDQRSGAQWVQPPRYTKPLATEVMYKFRIQLKGGPAGHAAYFQNDVAIATVPNRPLQVTPFDDVIFDFAFFSGGASRWYAPERDSYARHGGIRYWSGDEYQAA